MHSLFGQDQGGNVTTRALSHSPTHLPQEVSFHLDPPLLLVLLLETAPLGSRMSEQEHEREHSATVIVAHALSPRREGITPNAANVTAREGSAALPEAVRPEADPARRLWSVVFARGPSPEGERQQATVLYPVP